MGKAIITKLFSSFHSNYKTPLVGQQYGTKYPWLRSRAAPATELHNSAAGHLQELCKSLHFSWEAEAELFCNIYKSYLYPRMLSLQAPFVWSQVFPSLNIPQVNSKLCNTFVISYDTLFLSFISDSLVTWACYHPPLKEVQGLVQMHLLRDSNEWWTYSWICHMGTDLLNLQIVGNCMQMDGSGRAEQPYLIDNI